MSETKKYILRPGMKHSYIDNGKRCDVTGDGKVTIPLTDAQAINFRDKIVQKNSSDVTADAVDDADAGDAKADTSKAKASDSSSDSKAKK